ncbi:hypothetical protein CDD82_3103 [Ophiocordyceps australis]|uniref:Uncharacterized protein n=1 Tax=Ophiocordyceps australis TaxID=1399860 RepID=A0A2C5Z8Y9_9HYPO|nr:hypothetical protein CDD82_3103 [Ophiocordyceps australis]
MRDKTDKLDCLIKRRSVAVIDCIHRPWLHLQNSSPWTRGISIQSVGRLARSLDVDAILQAGGQEIRLDTTRKRRGQLSTIRGSLLASSRPPTDVFNWHFAAAGLQKLRASLHICPFSTTRVSFLPVGAKLPLRL